MLASSVCRRSINQQNELLFATELSIIPNTIGGTEKILYKFFYIYIPIEWLQNEE